MQLTPLAVLHMGSGLAALVTGPVALWAYAHLLKAM
jgi:hypothetical protein